MKRLLFILLFLPALMHAQGWQKIGSANPRVGVKSLYKIDADSGVLSKGVPVLTVSDTIGNKAYIDSLHNELSGAWLQVTGSGSIKTITAVKASGDAWLSTSFTDNDNQNLQLSADDTLSISGGNKIKLPYLRQYLQEPVLFSTGTTAQTYTLPAVPDNTKHIQAYLNNALIYPVNYTLTGNQITFNFLIDASDYLAIFFKNP